MTGYQTCTPCRAFFRVFKEFLSVYSVFTYAGYAQNVTLNNNELI